MAPNREVNDMNKTFQCSDHQSHATNIYRKFHKKISSDPEEIEKHKKEWGPEGHDMRKIVY